MEELSIGAIEAAAIRFPCPKCAICKATSIELVCMRDTVGCCPMGRESGEDGIGRGEEDREH
jgi:hypothetical protein